MLCGELGDCDIRAQRAGYLGERGGCTIPGVPVVGKLRASCPVWRQRALVHCRLVMESSDFSAFGLVPDQSHLNVPRSSRHLNAGRWVRYEFSRPRHACAVLPT